MAREREGGIGEREGGSVGEMGESEKGEREGGSLGANWGTLKTVTVLCEGVSRRRRRAKRGGGVRVRASRSRSQRVIATSVTVVKTLFI